MILILLYLMKTILVTGGYGLVGSAIRNISNNYLGGMRCYLVELALCYFLF